MNAFDKYDAGLCIVGWDANGSEVIEPLLADHPDAVSDLVHCNWD